jgi:hypothetical protein
MSLSSEEELRAFIANLLAINEELRKKVNSTKAKLLEVTKNTQDKISLKGERSLLIIQLTIIIYFRPYKF